MQNGSTIFELPVYLQYDSQFQQAVDEKLVTRCVLQHTQPASESTFGSKNEFSLPIVSNTEKQSRRSDSVSSLTSSTKMRQPSTQFGHNNISNLHQLITKSANLPMTSYQSKEIHELLTSSMN